MTNKITAYLAIFDNKLAGAALLKGFIYLLNQGAVGWTVNVHGQDSRAWIVWICRLPKRHTVRVQNYPVEAGVINPVDDIICLSWGANCRPRPRVVRAVQYWRPKQIIIGTSNAVGYCDGKLIRAAWRNRQERAGLR